MGSIPGVFLGSRRTIYCGSCPGMATEKTCPCPRDSDHRVSLSGTQVRAMPGRGEMPTEEFTRLEVAQNSDGVYLCSPVVANV